jgi:hypothetical protein
MEEKDNNEEMSTGPIADEDTSVVIGVDHFGHVTRDKDWTSSAFKVK